MNGEIDGYIGESVSVETAYAALCRKPVFLTRSPTRYSESVKPELRSLLERQYDHMHVLPLDGMEPNAILDTVSASAVEQDYGLTEDDTRLVMSSVYALVQEYGRYWQEFNRADPAS